MWTRQCLRVGASIHEHARVAHRSDEELCALGARVAACGSGALLRGHSPFSGFRKDVSLRFTLKAKCCDLAPRNKHLAITHAAVTYSLIHALLRTITAAGGRACDTRSHPRPVLSLSHARSSLVSFYMFHRQAPALQLPMVFHFRLSNHNLNNNKSAMQL